MMERPVPSNDKSKIYYPVDPVTVWVDGGIMLKTREPHGDPVEMTEEEAGALAKLLMALVEAERTGGPFPD